MTFALAVTHPEVLAAAFPISGLLRQSLYPAAALSSRPRPATLPPIAAFHGASDLALPTRGARASIAELQRAGYTAELREYAGGRARHLRRAAGRACGADRAGRRPRGQGAIPTSSILIAAPNKPAQDRPNSRPLDRHESASNIKR